MQRSFSGFMEVLATRAYICLRLLFHVHGDLILTVCALSLLMVRITSEILQRDMTFEIWFIMLSCVM